MQACDRPPRALRFVRSTARLRRGAGRQLCLTVAQLRPGQSRTFGVTFRLRANVTAATVTNGGSVDIPAGSAPVPPAAAPAPLPPDAAGTPPPRRHVVAKDSTTIRVRRTVSPNFTG